MWCEASLCGKMKWALVSDWPADEGLPNALRIIRTNQTVFDFVCIHTYSVSHTLLYSFITRGVAPVKPPECDILL